MRGTPAFVGRAAELAVLHDTLEAGRAEPAVMLVAGEAGIGKTWLARQALGLLGPDAVVATGASTGRFGSSIPFEPWVPILEELLAARGGTPDAACRGLGVDPSHLRGILPSLPSDVGLGDPSRLVPAVTRLVRAAATESHVVLLIDDLHWADDASLRVLASLVPELHSERLVLLLLTRSIDVSPGSARGEAIQRVLRSPSTRTVTLAPLADSEAAELLDSMGLVGDHARDVAEIARGNPLLLAQLARVRPESLRRTAGALMAAALDDLDDHALGAVRVVAASGAPIEEPLVLAVLDRLGLDGRRGVAAAISADVIRRTGGDRGAPLASTHDLLSEAVLGELDHEERRLIHSSLLDALESSLDRLAPATLARHALAAGRDGDALGYLIEAGLAARALREFTEADHHFDLAAGSWRASSQTSAQGLSPTAFALLRIANADDALRHDKALGLIEQAEARIGPLDRGLRAQLELRRAAVLQHELRFSEAASALVPVLANLPTVGDRREAAHLLALAHLHSGLDLSAQEIQSLMADAAQHGGTLIDVGTAGVVAAASSTTYSQAAEALARAADAFVRADLPSYLEAVSYLSHAQYLAGDEQACMATLRRALQEVEGVPPEFEWYRDLFSTLLAYLLSLRGEWATAESLLGKGVWAQHPRVQNYRTIVSDRLDVLMTGSRPSYWPEIGTAVGEIGAYGAALEFTFWAGEPASGVSLADRAQGYSHPNDACHMAWLRARAYAEAGLPVPESVHSPLKGLHPVPEPADAIGLQRLADAEAARATDSDTSGTWLDAAVALDAACRPYPAAYARCRAATRLVLSGSVAEATEPLRMAYEAATALPLPPLVNRLESLARRARITLLHTEPPTSTSGCLAVLTRRERDVIHLVAAGATNGEIATRLHVGKSTVATHISSILRKLDVPSRYAAAALLDGEQVGRMR